VKAWSSKGKGQGEYIMSAKNFAGLHVSSRISEAEGLDPTQLSRKRNGRPSIQCTMFDVGFDGL